MFCRVTPGGGYNLRVNRRTWNHTYGGVGARGSKDLRLPDVRQAWREATGLVLAPPWKQGGELSLVDACVERFAELRSALR